MMNWELVHRDDNQVMERTAVDGGWLYRYQMRQGSDHGGYTWSIAMAFVPEPAAPPP